MGLLNTDIDRITPWLLGINFTIAVFSINFTFFGYQLSKYKPIYSEITERQWFNIVTIIILPFIPLISYLISPDYFGKVALFMLPVLILSAIDNAILTTKYLSPTNFIKDNMNDRKIQQYLSLLSKEIKNEVDEHEEYLEKRKEYQIPPHGYEFEPTVFGVECNDLWDTITIITKLSIENNDYPVFRKSISVILKLIKEFYLFKYKDEDKALHKVDRGIKIIAHTRFRSIVCIVIDNDKENVFLNSVSNELCGFLMGDELLNNPCSDITRAIASDIVWIGQKMIESNNVIEPINILNTIHRVIEINIHRFEVEANSGVERTLDVYNISMYAYDVKKLGVTALNNENAHFAYRCMESLSYLGCNAAKLKSTQTVVAVFESIVHLGRVARSLNIGCFWSRCLIPAESHAEEFMGHILTWLIQDIDAKGYFFMKEYAEQSYSRLRGIKCLIKPKNNSNPCFWVEEIEDDGKKVPHVEYQSGMYGYSGKSDYSDFSNLKEYVLHGIGSKSEARVFHGSPIPIELDDEDSI